MAQGLLFVDDEVGILKALDRELRPWLARRHLEFCPALSGSQALALLHERAEDILVVVSDMKMPGIAGDSLLEEIGRRWPQVETMVLSGHAEPAHLSRAVGAGIRGYLTKPWEPDALTALLDQAVERAAAQRRDQRERQHLRDQLTRTRQTQTALFRYAVDELPDFEFELTYRPFEDLGCGGDFYEVFALGPRRCACLVGDVAGHGVDAAFVTGVVHMLIHRDDVRGLLGLDNGPGRFLERLNQELYDHLSGATGINVALTVLVLDADLRQASYAHAGSPPAFRLRGGLAESFHVPALPLGVVGSVAYPSRTVDFPGGDRWLLLSDGLLDRGPEGLVSLLEIATEVEASFVTGVGSHLGQEHFVQGVLGHFATGVFGDDVTVLSVGMR